jgi:NAD+ kinase
MKVAIYARKINKIDLPFFQDLLKKIHSLGWTPILEQDLLHHLKSKFNLAYNFETFNTYRDFLSGIELGISIGGDGTFLKFVTYVRSSGVPVMGINTGRLGFLANTSREDLEKVLNKVAKKDYVFQKRSLIKVTTDENYFGDDNYGLNELAVHKKDTSSMITVHAELDGKFLNSYWADGLIVATPTGSTAYSLSCGGPIITPGCAVHILSPIAPHNLNVRPVVVPDHMPIKLTVDGRDRSYLLTLDSYSKVVKRGTEVHLEKASFMINVIKFEENNFLDTIRNKMMWGLDKRN